MFKVFYFGWDSDCLDEDRNVRRLYSTLYREVKKNMKLQDRFQFAIIVDLENADAVQITKEWQLKTSPAEKDVIRALMQEED